MKVTRVEGCMAYGIKIDDVDFEVLKHDEKRTAVRLVLEHVKRNADEKSYQRIIEDVLYHVESSEYECDDEPCEQCGDRYSEETWEVDS